MEPSSSAPYAELLERTRLPVPTFQRLAVISIFQKLPRDPDSDAARDSLSRCLSSPSAAVLDQSVRELCRLVRSHRLPVPRALVELQSALEGCTAVTSATVLVKGIGFICRLAFLEDPSWRRQLAESPQTRHPFVRVLSSRDDVNDEILQQMVLFIVQNTTSSVELVFEFVRPVLTFAALKIASSAEMGPFISDFISATAANACSLHLDGMLIINHLVDYLKFFPCRNDKDAKLYLNCAEYLVEAFVGVLTQSVRAEKPILQTKTCCLNLLEILLSVSINLGGLSRSHVAAELSKHLLVAYKDFDLDYEPEFVMITLSLSINLSRLEFEHEQLSMLNLLIYMIEWKSKEQIQGKISFSIQEFLLLFPTINLLSSPSKPVKNAATYMLTLLERCLENSLILIKGAESSHVEVPTVSKPEVIVSRFLHCLWFQEQAFQSCLHILDLISSRDSSVVKYNSKLVLWIFELTGESSSVIARPESTPASISGDPLFSGVRVLLSIVSAILAIHPTIAASSSHFLASVCRMNPKASMPLFLTILLYSKICCSSSSCSELLLQLLEMLPTLASHALMLPLIIQSILPMLDKNVEPSLHATAIRLLCKTWTVSGKRFGSLQDVLENKSYDELASRRDISLAVAASVCDVCKCNPDRGVDLIHLVSLCVENDDAMMQAFGLESLSHLCEADVVDFYTAWKVIAVNIQSYSVEPVVAYSLCTLLRWGAMDAKAYPEDSKAVIQILWDIATSQNRQPESKWSNVRCAAVESLVKYEVGIVCINIENFKERNIDFLINEGCQEVLKSLEQFEINVINYEHITRRRSLKEKRSMVHKVDKLLDLFPQAVFTPGMCERDLPGAFLLSHSFTPKEIQSKGTWKDLRKLHIIYEHKLLEIAEYLHLTRHPLYALLALQSWKTFVDHWMRSSFVIIGSDSHSGDGNLQAVKEIFEILCRSAESSIPCTAENIVLAVGALCMVLKPSMHTIASSASDFLLKWLLQCEHEHMQWSAAVSLGFVSKYLHVTDRTRKYEIVMSLLKVMQKSKSFFVKGSCGVGLGFACQDLLTRAEIDGNSHFEESIIQTEAVLLGKILRSLCNVISSVYPYLSIFFETLLDNFPVDTVGEVKNDPSYDKFNTFEDDSGDICGMVGVVIGLGLSVSAVYRAGIYDVVEKIKDFLLSCIPFMKSYLHKFHFGEEFPPIALSTGACIVLPQVAAFCERAELTHNELNDILSGYNELISDLLATKKSALAHQVLLMASCFGAGTLVSCILNDGIQTLRVDDIKRILEVMRAAYTGSNTPLVVFGGILGVINAFGADAGLLTKSSSQPTFLLRNHSQEMSDITGPILASHTLEPISTYIAQEIFFLAKESTNLPTKKSAAWGLSFLRQRWRSKEFKKVADSKSTSQNFSEESLVWKLHSWMLQVCSSEAGVTAHMNTVIIVLRCLRKAPRMPLSSDWGRIIRYCMKQAALFSSKPLMEQSCKLLREECIGFCIDHADSVESLLLFLDEIMDIPRFSRFENSLQQSLLVQLCAITKVFDESRQKKLFSDLIEFFTSSTSLYYTYDPHQRCLMRICFWKGLSQCLEELVDKVDGERSLEICMEALFFQLPMFVCEDDSCGYQDIEKEWSEAVNCLAKSRLTWLVNLLQDETIKQEDGSRSDEVVKGLVAVARLVTIGHMPISELGKLKASIFNLKTGGSWSVLIEAFVAIYVSEHHFRRQWLIDVVDISVISRYPSVALQFMGIFSSISCKYRPLLVIDPITVLKDLPVTLPSLLSESSWVSVREPLAGKLWSLTERLCLWESHLRNGSHTLTGDGIDESENHLSSLLVDVVLQTCLSLKDSLPFEKQLKFANLFIHRSQCAQSGSEYQSAMFQTARGELL